MKMRCDCCDHPLQHTIRMVIARYEAPIPPPSARAMYLELRDELALWEAEQEVERPAGRG